MKTELSVFPQNDRFKQLTLGNPGVLESYNSSSSPTKIDVESKHRKRNPGHYETT